MSLAYPLQVPAADPPKRVIEAAIYAMDTDTGYTAEEIAGRIQSLTDSYVLKVYDSGEYMLQECCIHSYEVNAVLVIHEMYCKYILELQFYYNKLLKCSLNSK